MTTTPHDPPPLCISVDAVEAAFGRIRAALPLTPLTYATSISESLGREVFIKWDNRFRTGSF